MAGHAQSLAGEAQLFLRGGLHIHPVRGNAHSTGNVQYHLGNVGGQLGLLGNHGHIDVADPVARIFHLFSHIFQQL